MELNDNYMVIDKRVFEKLNLERDVAVEGYRQQFNLAHEVIKQNDELREQLQQARQRIIDCERMLKLFTQPEKKDVLWKDVMS
jgi:phospholipase/lecithinase/hemolysin